jgi:hypothetical protein
LLRKLLLINKLPYACGAPFGAASTRANRVRSTLIWKGQEFSLFGFLPAFFAENKCAKLGIAKTAR